MQEVLNVDDELIDELLEEDLITEEQAEEL